MSKLGWEVVFANPRSAVEGLGKKSRIGGWESSFWDVKLSVGHMCLRAICAYVLRFDSWFNIPRVQEEPPKVLLCFLTVHWVNADTDDRFVRGGWNFEAALGAAFGGENDV
jgi:hypothetical protein